ncbi:MAG TPA: alpha/beta hydrolase [Anaerolineae bacterium]|nr:alpha/beta hydrolase [Anaerolineae bacterium]
MSNHLAEREIEIDDIALTYKLAGEGRPLLILHGWGSSSDAWVEVQGKLARQGYRVCVPDLPGFGKSGPPPRPWGMDDYARFVANLAQRLGMEEFFLVGHSFGGRIGIRLTILHPERVLGLVLCASAGIKPKRTLKHWTFWALAKGGNALLSLPLLSRLREPARKGLYLLVGEWDYYRAQGVMKETVKKVIEEDLRFDLKDVTVPTLIVWGDRDRVTPLSDAHIMKKEIPNATLEILEGAGHRLPYEEPEIFTRLVLTFLGGIE